MPSSSGIDTGDQPLGPRLSSKGTAPHPSSKLDAEKGGDIQRESSGSDGHTAAAAAVHLGSSSNTSSSRDHTARRLKSRHIQLIGIGGTIGTALYVQIGRGLLNGGPGSLFIAFTLW